MNDSCQIFAYDNETLSDEVTCQGFLDDIETKNLSLTKCNSLVFDQEVVLNSIVTEYGLTCENQIIKNIIGATYMVIFWRLK